MRKLWNICVTAVLLTLIVAPRAAAQATATPDNKQAETKPPAAPETSAPKEESATSEHSAKIGGQTIPYKATVGSILVKNDKDEPTALIYYTAYTRSDAKDMTARPLSFIYNGGPGSASVWLHMGAFGPRRVATPDAAYAPPPPYRLTDNENSLLDKTDMVFLDPVGTGFSHAVGKAADKDFWGVDQDVKSLAYVVNIYVTRNNRWNSPKFLIGESYGTFRSAALGNYLQNHDTMALNGIVLISNVLDLGQLSFLPGDDISYVLYLPSYAATAWYHKMLKDRPADLPAFIDEARKFAAGEYATALMKGSALGDSEKSAVAAKLSRFTGLSEDYLVKADLRVVLPQFMIELQRARGLTTGRLDARFSGPTYDVLSEFAQSDPQSDAISSAFVATFNNYVREELKFNPAGDRQYNPLNGGANGVWDWKHQGAGGFGFPGSPNVEGDLVQLILTNPHLQVEVENGYYDLATPFYGSEYTMDHLGLKPDLRKNIQLKYYDAGHMMYVHDADLGKLHANVAAFIDRATKQ
jgi:carboxypeptidase C (cathepsin A)